MTTVVRTLERCADWLLIALFTLIFALVLAQVFFRYVLNDPLVWSEELARLAFIWVAMLTWGLGSRRRSHIAVTFLPDMLPRTPRLVVAMLVQALIIVFCAVLAVHGVTLTERNTDLSLVTLEISYAVVYVVVPIGAAIVVFYSLAEIHRLAQQLRAGEGRAVIEAMAFVLLGWLVILLMGVPIFASMGLAAVAFIYWGGFPGVVIPQKVAQAANSFPLLAAPFFILMGNLMNSAGITDRIFRFAKVCVGWWRGGLCHANILASVIFAGMSGSAVADAAGLGTVEIKAMKDAGYDADTAAAVTAASATIGPIIPPSLPMIIYGVVAEASIGGLFIGAIIPGLLMAVAMMVLVTRMAHKRNMPREPYPSLRDVWHAFRGAFWALMAPFLLIGGMMSGIFTPTEAAAVAAFYALILGLFIYRDFDIRELPQIILNTVETTGVLLAIVMCAVLFGWAMSISQFPQAIGALIVGWTSEPLMILLLVNILLLIVGCFMEAIAAMLILIPILVPVAMKVGIDPIQFGVVFVLNLMIGTVTPPVGMVLFVTSKVAEISFERVTRATMPFLVPLLAVLAAITLWPPLTTWLPGIVFGR